MMRFSTAALPLIFLSEASSNCLFLRVTLDDGSQWLIHKGDNFGRSSQTVVTPAHDMSSKWKVNLCVFQKQMNIRTDCQWVKLLCSVFFLLTG